MSRRKVATKRGQSSTNRAEARLVPIKTPSVTSGVLFERVVTILETARTRVARTINSEMILAYWEIGREIVEYVQRGSKRAEYGEGVLGDLSDQLRARFGRGYSVTNLRYFRLFYQTYAHRKPEIRHKRCDELTGDPKKHHEPCDVSTVQGRRSRSLEGKVLERAMRGDAELQGFSSQLSWSHYRTLTKVEQPAARAFYEIEAERAGWSVPQLERQIHTQLFARLMKSRDQAGVLDLASRGQVLERPIDAIKQPYVLDFLDLPESPQVRESDLEGAILIKLQHFLLELGNGFAFVARQKRLSFDDEHFYVDLVFYNVILKCYLLVDLKLGKLTHQDVGQMDSYVRLFDAQGRNPGDGPTIGLILCAEKNEAVARYSVLHGNEQLFAAKYVMYLPSEELLAKELELERLLLEQEARAASPAPRRTPQKQTARSVRAKPRRKGA